MALFAIRKSYTYQLGEYDVIDQSRPVLGCQCFSDGPDRAQDLHGVPRSQTHIERENFRRHWWEETSVYHVHPNRIWHGVVLDATGSTCALSSLGSECCHARLCYHPRYRSNASCDYIQIPFTYYYCILMFFFFLGQGIIPTIILVRVSMGLSFHDDESMVEATTTLRFQNTAKSEDHSFESVTVVHDSEEISDDDKYKEVGYP